MSNPPGVVPASGAVDTDSDGVLRRLIYVPVRLQAFAIRAAEMAQGRSIPAVQVPDNHAWIDFSGPPGTYLTYSMADVLDGTVPFSAFAGKIVLVGVTAPIAKDVFTTSASSDPMSGVEVQANSIETALRGFPLQSADPVLSLALILALALAPVALSLRLSSLLVGLSSIVLAVLFLGAAQFAFARGLVLPVPDPIAGLGIATAGVIAVESLIDRRKRQSLEMVLQDILRPGDRGLLCVLPAGPEQLRRPEPAISTRGPLRRRERVHGRGGYQSRSGVAAGDTRGDTRLPRHARDHRPALAHGTGRRIGHPAAGQPRRLDPARSGGGSRPPGSGRHSGFGRWSEHAGQR